MTTTVNTDYAPLIAAVLRARARISCNYLAIAVRGTRAAVVLRIPCTTPNGRPATFSHYVTGFCSVPFLDMACEATERLTPRSIRAHLQVALSIARTPQRHSALVEVCREYAHTAPASLEAA